MAKLRGPLLINIWAGPVHRMQGRGAAAAFVRGRGRAGKVAVLGIVDGAYNGSETWDDALDASHGLGLAYPSVWDANGKFVQYLRVPGIPVSIFVDASGTVTHAKIGVLAPGELAKLSAQYLGVTVTDATDTAPPEAAPPGGWRRCCRRGRARSAPT